MNQIIFSIITILGMGYAFKQYAQLRRNVFIGKNEEIKGDKGARWKNVLLIALGQKKMFKRWVPAFLHLFIYVAFLITQIELIEILVDGFLGKHRIFATPLGGLYTFAISFIEILSVLAFIGTVAFLIRRNIIKVDRFHKPEMKGWPFKDGNLILIFELLLLFGIFSMNGADTVLQGLEADHYSSTGNFAISSWLGPAIFGGLGESTLIFIERSGWWLHYLMVLVFLNYLPKSKHLHVIFAFPNTYYSPLRPRGEMENMPVIMDEVKSMMGLIEEQSPEDMAAELPEFGAKDVVDLGWTTILAAYTCTECGRCTDECPANITGKKLSPRKIMMDVRNRTEEVAQCIASGNKEYAKDKEQPLSKSNFDDSRSLFDFISKEEIWACTTCNACIEACPVLIRPMDVILELRRYELLTLSQGPQELMPLFNSIENGGSAWAMSTDRDQWAKDVT